MSILNTVLNYWTTSYFYISIQIIIQLFLSKSQAHHVDYKTKIGNGQKKNQLKFHLHNQERLERDRSRSILIQFRILIPEIEMIKNITTDIIKSKNKTRKNVNKT